MRWKLNITVSIYTIIACVLLVAGIGAGLAVYVATLKGAYQEQINMLEQRIAERDKLFKEQTAIVEKQQRRIAQDSIAIAQLNHDIDVVETSRDNLIVKYRTLKTYYEKRSVYITTLDSTGKQQLWSAYLIKYEQRFDPDCGP